MPFKSEAQRKKFRALVASGDISQKTYDEWEAATPKNVKLPYRVGREAAKKKYGLKPSSSKRRERAE